MSEQEASDEIRALLQNFATQLQSLKERIPARGSAMGTILILLNTTKSQPTTQTSLMPPPPSSAICKKLAPAANNSVSTHRYGMQISLISHAEKNLLKNGHCHFKMGSSREKKIPCGQWKSSKARFRFYSMSCICTDSNHSTQYLRILKKFAVYDIMDKCRLFKFKSNKNHYLLWKSIYFSICASGKKRFSATTDQNDRFVANTLSFGMSSLGTDHTTVFAAFLFRNISNRKIESN